MAKQSILLIINPVAGRKKAKSMLYRIVDSLYRSNYISTVFITTKKGEATDIVVDNAKNYDKIICCGGDGTLNEVLTGVTKAKLLIPVGYIPTGTTNDLASSLKLPSKLSDVIDVVRHENTRHHDIGKFNDTQYFSYVASFGAFTKTAYITPQWLKNLFGRVAYLFNGIQSIKDIRLHTVTVVADGQKIKGDFIFGSISNATVIGGIIKLSETMVLFDDGMFEVLLIKKPTGRKDFHRTIESISKQSFIDENIYYFKAKKYHYLLTKVQNGQLMVSTREHLMMLILKIFHARRKLSQLKHLHIKIGKEVIKMKRWLGIGVGSATMITVLLSILAWRKKKSC